MTTYPAFIGGFRSGSTLLVNYLGLNPCISSIYETKFLADLLRVARMLLNEDGRRDREMAVIARWTGNPDISLEKAVDFAVQRALSDVGHTQRILDGVIRDGKAPYERYALGGNHILWSAEESREAVAPFVQAVQEKSPPDSLLPILASGMQKLFALHAAREGKEYWVNKTPEILRFQPELSQMMGRIRWVHLIRDGRDVVNSSVRLNWWPVERGARWWKMFIEEVRAHAARHPEDYLELRYEELVRDHRGAIARVLDFLEIEGDAAEMVNAQERFAPGSTSAAEAKLRIGRWRSGLSEDDKKVFKAKANDLLVSLDYAKDAQW